MKFLIPLAILSSTPFANALPKLIKGDAIFCRAENSAAIQIDIMEMENEPKVGHARVVIGNFGTTLRTFAGPQAEVVEARDWLHVELRSEQSLYARIMFRDSIVFGRETEGKLDYQNGNRTNIRCLLER